MGQHEPMAAAMPQRNAFAEWAHVPSRLVFEGEDRRRPRITIAIPTFHRPHLLVEAVASAIAQDLTDPVEVIVVDNDPQSRGCDALLEQLPQLRRHNFRYYVNSENLGMFPNWNRCIELGRGDWHSLLNDDDLLDTDFCSTMFPVLDKGTFDALICRKRTLDQRRRLDEAAAASPRRGGALRRLGKRAYLEARFHGKAARLIPARKYFFGSLTGNTVGLIARKQDLLTLGGYFAEDYPSADQYFMTRLAMRFRLGEMRRMLVSIRIAENESARPEVIRGFLQRNQQLRERLAGTEAPVWWMRLSPLIVARHRGQLRDGFGGEVSDAEIRDLLGVRPQKDRKLLFYLVCGAIGGL